MTSVQSTPAPFQPPIRPVDNNPVGAITQIPKKLEFSSSDKQEDIIESLKQNPDIIELHISGQKITPMLWELICDCSKLEKLHLPSCEMLLVPCDIEKLSQLKTLDLSHSAVKFLSPELAKLPLETLNLTHTQIRKLTDEILKIKSLVKLTLADCSKLEVLPKEGWDLPELQELDLGGCVSLKHLHEKKWNLPKLRNVNLSYLSINKIPDIFSRLDLHILNLSHNPINTLYVEDNGEDGDTEYLKNLKELNISGCQQILTVPTFTNLTKLTIFDCNLQFNTLNYYKAKQVTIEGE